MKTFLNLFFVLSLLFCSFEVQTNSFKSKIAESKPIDIVIWHSLAEQLGNELKEIATAFNRQSPEYRIKLVYKGDYTESITNFAAAFRAKQPPALIHIFEVGSLSVLQPPGVIKPLNQLMGDANLTLPENDFLSAVRVFYSEKEHLVAMPLNISIPVMYYNADVLEKLGYKQFPATWQEMELLMEKLKHKGYSCGYTTAYPSWIHIESFAALHGLPLFDPKMPIATYNNEAVISHLARLRDWQRKRYFKYGGRTSAATILFTSEHCPVFSQSSGSYNSLLNIVKFKLGVAPIPIDKNVSSIRHNNVVGGGALWAVSGQSPKVYEGIARFYSYLAQPHVQKRWYENSGYLPLGLVGVYNKLENEEEHPILKLAKIDLMKQEPPVQQSAGPQNLIRAINDEALEAIFSGIRTAKEAMNKAVRLANYSLMRFVRNTEK